MRGGTGGAGRALVLVLAAGLAGCRDRVEDAGGTGTGTGTGADTAAGTDTDTGADTDTDTGSGTGSGTAAGTGTPTTATATATATASVSARAMVPLPRAARFDEDPRVRAACPADMALVEGEFCPVLPLACLEASDETGYRCAEYARGMRCGGKPDPRRYCIDRHEWPNRPGEMPRVFVDWHEARSLCTSAGKRLCRRSEWMLACEGPKRLPYPWGFVRQPSPCNIDRAAIPFDAAALAREPTREVELSRLWQGDAIGSHPDCVSAYGAYDMSGNVDEWTDNQADNPATRFPSTLNGGYWGPVRDTCRLITRKHGPRFRFYQAGFRCCSDTVDGLVPPPPLPFVEDEEHMEEEVEGEGVRDAPY